MSDVRLVHSRMRSAFRARLLSLVKATTGSVALAVDANGRVTRQSGSFLTDLFTPGDEVTLSGFTGGNNATVMVTAVAAGVLTVDPALTLDAEAGSRSVTCGCPAARHWEGAEFTPPNRRPFVSEVMVVMPAEVRAVGVGGLIQHPLLGTFTLFYPAKQGPLAIERMAGALMHHFRPGTGLVSDGQAGTVLRVERERLEQQPDWISCPVMVSVVAYTVN